MNHRWVNPVTCDGDERIDHLMHNQTNEIGMIIQNRTDNHKSFQLRNDQTLERIWSIELDQCQTTIHRTRFTLIHPNHWLIIDSNQSKFFIRNKDGLLKQTIDYPHDQPHRALQMTSHFLLITARDSVNLHQLQF